MSKMSSVSLRPLSAEYVLGTDVSIVRMSGSRTAPTAAGGHACASARTPGSAPPNVLTSAGGVPPLKASDVAPVVSATFLTMVLSAGRPMRSICAADGFGSGKLGVLDLLPLLQATMATAIA